MRKAKSRRDCAARLNLESKKSGTSKTKQKDSAAASIVRERRRGPLKGDTSVGFPI